MKKSILFIFLALFLPLSAHALSTVGVISGGGGATISWSSDTPYDEGGDGFVSGDDCGYVMGTADTYTNSTLAGDFEGTVKFTEVDNNDQGCVDENGYFYSSSSRESYADYYSFMTGGVPATYTMDFTWSSNTNKNMVVDSTTGEWTCGRGNSCYARFTDTSLSNRWVWFDWECGAGSACEGQDTDKYHVYTDTDTGAVSGYAWNDTFGFLSFIGLSQELPPVEIITYIDVLTYDEVNGLELSSDQVDYTTAPLADGYDDWRIRVQFQNSLTGEYLTADDISQLSITEVATGDSNVFLNQVENQNNAIDTSYVNYADPSVGCTDDTVYCVQTEQDGSASFNRYIYSAAPTSNVLGLNDDTDTSIEYPSDRDGCRWVYRDQWEEVDGAASQIRCYDWTTGTYELTDKDDVFYSRSSTRNKYAIETIVLSVVFSSSSLRDITIREWDDTATDGSAFQEVNTASATYYYYTPSGGSSELSFRPRYQIEKFVTYYDGREHTDISSDPSKIMSLATEATIYSTSPGFQAVGGSDNPTYKVYYQMDADSDTTDPVLGDMYLLIDTDEPPNSPGSGDVEETHREDVVIASTSYKYIENYAIAYGQKASDCGPLAGCPASQNTLSNPTAEQWVCDSTATLRFVEESCYYTEYLPHVDRHSDPQSMFVIGAINSVIDEGDFLNEDYISVLGAAKNDKLRNKMYAQLARYTLGQTGGSGSLMGDGLDPSGDIVPLMNDRLLFAEGDVTIEGCSTAGCTGINKTLVVLDGDVFINGNITGLKLGLISFGSGDVWVKSDVNNLYVNFFLDGSLFTYDGTAPAEDYPTWYSDEVRLEGTKNQLYIKGSLVSRNTVNGLDTNGDGSFDASSDTGPWPRGDGTTSSSFAEAREYDLNMLRQYRLCYVLDADGTPSATTEECNEGETLSEYRDESGSSIYNSLIIEYNPSSDLPIFNVDSGLFR